MLHTNYIALAQQVHNLDTYNKMYQAMNNFQVLSEIFMKQCPSSQHLLFVASEMLAKKLINHEIMLGVDDYEYSNKLNDNLEGKKFVLLQIATFLYEYVNSTVKQPYIIRSCINTISLCIYATVSSSNSVDSHFLSYFQTLLPDYAVDERFFRSGTDNSLCYVAAVTTPLPPHHEKAVAVWMSLLEYVTNSTYFMNYYYFRRNLYMFRNHYLAYILNYSMFVLKSAFAVNLAQQNVEKVLLAIRQPLKFFESVVMYPFSINNHDFELEDDIHENISGLQSQIYFPSYFRNLLCDTGFLMDLINYYSLLNSKAMVLDPIREDIYCLVRIIGRLLSTSDYVFVGEDEKKTFSEISVSFITKILKQNKFFDSYLLICIAKINIKFMSIENDEQLYDEKKQYFGSLLHFILAGLQKCQGKIEDGDKHPYRQLFQMLTAFINITTNTLLDSEAKICAERALNILLTSRMVNNEDNERMMQEFGYSNSQEVQCFQEIFAKVPEIFKINLSINKNALETLHQLDLSKLNSASLTFWLHLTALLLPSHDTSQEQVSLIIKFLEAAIQAGSIASLHFIQTLVSEILYDIRDGVSTTYLWKFIEEFKMIKFEQFLSNIIKYSMKILTVPNFTLIQNCLQLFKIMFTKLCKYRHKSFIAYFQIIEQVCKQIDQTMLVQPEYYKLRIGFFSIISIIWVNEGQPGFVYRIFNNIRLNLNEHADFVHFIRYMTDITGLLEPVESAEVFKILIELVLVDMQAILPFYFATPDKISAAFSNQVFLKVFIKFLLTIVNDHGYRLSYQVQTELPFLIEQTFRPYLIEAIKYDYPDKTIEAWLKFIKLNPLGKLIPLHTSLKQKNSIYYKNLLREYFQNLHRLETLPQFYHMYGFIGDSIELMSDWWEEIMARGLKPEVNVALVVNAHIWQNRMQKEQLAKLLYRVGRYDERYWRVQAEAAGSENKYVEWFTTNYQ